MAATRGRGSTEPDAYRSIVPARPGDALRMPTAVTSFNASVRVSMVLGVPARPDVDHSLARLDQLKRLGRELGRVRGVDDGVEGQPWDVR